MRTGKLKNKPVKNRFKEVEQKLLEKVRKRAHKNVHIQQSFPPFETVHQMTDHVK